PSEARSWEYGAPLGLGGELGCPDPNSGHTGSYVLGFNLSGDYCDLGVSANPLVLCPIDCTGLSHVSVKFWRWLGVGWGLRFNGRHASVEVSSDYDNWTTVWENKRHNLLMADDGWVEMELDIAEVADDQPQVWLRWTMGPVIKPINVPVIATYCGWNVDDIQLVAILTDCNENGIQDVRDIAECDPNEPACQDCNENNVPDGCDITSATSQDANENGIPDECE
ncbi:MAG: hypothetical protein KKI02_04130, partial [Planctomycetes bacterium]|nr:hypothetical protein [Planctomycetota bacterium]